MSKKGKEIEIKKTKLILAEGVDATYFLIYLLEALHIEDIQVFDYGGITELTQFLNNLSKLDKYDEVSTIIIARDSETAVESSIQSVNDSLKKANLTKDDIMPFKIEQKMKKLGLVLFPGHDEQQQLCKIGTLEDLCLKIFNDQATVGKIDSYIVDFQTNKKPFKRIHKNKLHATLSFTDDYVGSKLGEVVKMGGYDLKSSYLTPFLDIIRAL
jgi:hypothetical protein